MTSSVPSIPGQRITGDLLHSFRREVADLLGRNNNTNFPGAQPVSFASYHLEELKQRDYYVCEKSDGIRVMMYFTEGNPGQEVHYLIDRKNDYYYVEGLHFPIPGEDLQKFHKETVIDGELVNDRLPNGGTQLKYLVFDCLIVDGQSLIDRPLDKRLAYFRERVNAPYQALLKRFPEEVQYMPFLLEFKSFQLGYGAEMMFKDVLPKLPHGNDGLIFTCRTTPYHYGTDKHILKWKPSDINTIDFQLNMEFPLMEPDADDIAAGVTEPFTDYDAKPLFHLSCQGRNNSVEYYAEMYVSDEEWEALKALNEPLEDRIVECASEQTSEGGRRWRYHRFRDDKKGPNYIEVVEKTMESIRDPVDQERLIKAAPEIKRAWKRRNAPPTG